MVTMGAVVDWASENIDCAGLKLLRAGDQSQKR